MVKINHINGDEKLVTKGAFESIFKPLGYKVVANKVEIKENKETLTGEKTSFNNDIKEHSDKNNFKQNATDKRK